MDELATKKKVYVASGLKNYQEVLRIQWWLTTHLDVQIAFDWASRHQEELSRGFPLRLAEKQALAKEEADGVLRSHALLLVAPGKRGAHVEFGTAYGAGIPVVVMNPDASDDISFYHLPTVRLTRHISSAYANLAEVLRDGE